MCFERTGHRERSWGGHVRASTLALGLRLGSPASRPTRRQRGWRVESSRARTMSAADDRNTTPGIKLQNLHTNTHKSVATEMSVGNRRPVLK
jgi:hypothetical protein